MKGTFYEIVGLRTCQAACSPSTHIPVHAPALIQVLELPLDEIYMEGRTTLIPILFRLCHPEVTLRDYCGIVSPWCSNTSILYLFTCVALESSPKYRVIFILYLRRLAHTYRDERDGGGGQLMECLCLLMAFQINTTQLCSPAWETLSATVALMGWSPLMKSLLDSIDGFILAPSPMSVHFFSDPLSHSKVIDTKPTLKSSQLLWYDLAQ